MILDEFGVVAAIDHFIHETMASEEVQILFVHEIRFNRLASPLETALFRVVQEAVTNAIQHSQSNVVHVELGVRDGLVQVAVRDGGIGFDPTQVEAQQRFGLREYVSVLGCSVAMPESRVLPGAELTSRSNSLGAKASSRLNGIWRTGNGAKHDDRFNSQPSFEGIARNRGSPLQDHRQPALVAYDGI